MAKPITLDDWHRLINSIYIDRNFYRSPESIFCHLTEVIGCLSVVSSHKNKPGIAPEVFLAKSVGWWMALCGKVGVKSVEAMIWAKFPFACPYCQKGPHQSKCAQDRAARKGPQGQGAPDWKELEKIGATDKGKTPRTVSGWQEMFDFLYPRSDQTTQEIGFSRLSEELGELAEGIRVLPVKRAYFLSEAADVFAWLMGVANQLQVDNGLLPVSKTPS